MLSQDMIIIIPTYDNLGTLCDVITIIIRHSDVNNNHLASFIATCIAYAYFESILLLFVKICHLSGFNRVLRDYMLIFFEMTSFF